MTTALTFELSDGNAGIVTFNSSMSTHDVSPTQSGGDVVYRSLQGNMTLGALIADTVEYEFGNYNKGDLYLQPNGDTSFPTDKMILIETEVITSDLSACGPAPGDNNIMYYNSSTGCGGGSGNRVKIVYFYLNALYNDTATFKPYAGMTSGKPIKYAGNYGTGIAADTFSNSVNAEMFDLTKTASCGICSASAVITYTIEITNNDNVALMLDRIVDSLPEDHTFIGFASGSDVDASNTSSYPAGGATGNIEFVGLIPQTFPYRSYVIPAGGSIQLKYDVQAPATTSNTLYQNRAFGMVGNTAFDTAYAITCVGCSALPVELIDFKASLAGDQVQLEWSTAAEVDNFGFDVYRINGDRTRTHVGFVEGQGNTATRHDYVVFDELPTTVSQVYELVQRDFNGNTESFFTSVHMPVSTDQSEVVVFPNPTSGKITIRSESNDFIKGARLFSLNGKVLLEHGTSLSNDVSLNASHLKFGVYILEVYSETGAITRRKIYKH